METDKILIYPNPTTGDFTIYNSNPKFSVEIFNLIGQKILGKQSMNSNSLSVSKLPKGIYLIKITDGTQSIIKKIVIN